MRLWVDAQLAPALASWISSSFGVDASHVRDHGLRDATDDAIFFAARDAGAVVLTKDGDFVRLVEKHGAPPQVCWITCGNTSNERMKEVLEEAFERAALLLADGEPLVEISDRTLDAPEC